MPFGVSMLLSAFDALGHRLGRGRGYYDRFLRTLGMSPVCVRAYSASVSTSRKSPPSPSIPPTFPSIKSYKNSPPKLGGARGGLNRHIKLKWLANLRATFFTFSPFHLFTFSPLKRSIPHTTGRSYRRQKCRERGYYHLHRKLNHTLLLHKP